MELSDLYSTRILEIAGNPPLAPPLATAQGRSRKVSRVCGSIVEVGLDLVDGVVGAYGHEVTACALGQTSAAIMAREIAGSTPAELRTLRETMRAMLKEGGPPPSGKWEDLKYLEPVREYPQRHTSTLLVFEAVAEALDMAERAANADPGEGGGR